MSTTTVKKTTTVRCIKCDFCHATSDFYRMYKCYGCEKDICGTHAVCEELPAGSDNCIFLCGECSPSFGAANDAASDIVSEANDRADKIMNAWRLERRITVNLD